MFAVHDRPYVSLMEVPITLCNPEPLLACSKEPSGVPQRPEWGAYALGLERVLYRILLHYQKRECDGPLSLSYSFPKRVRVRDEPRHGERRQQPIRIPEPTIKWHINPNDPAIPDPGLAGFGDDWGAPDAPLARWGGGAVLPDQAINPLTTRGSGLVRQRPA
ncbi:Hypothetical predicted protein [Olea europaea subsp. europaea]|uniref:Uncharacterized protein n=1 Tax=Olea europaea subsp. europaea TaxID=158383 RepID=A0A8S0TM74_OLEEU|nr:Hypothetical predicted protein [Olea europaea subsp. europaea]